MLQKGALSFQFEDEDDDDEADDDNGEKDDKTELTEPKKRLGELQLVVVTLYFFEYMLFMPNTLFAPLLTCFLCTYNSYCAFQT